MIELLMRKMTTAEKTMKIFKARLVLKFMGKVSRILILKSSIIVDTLTGISISNKGNGHLIRLGKSLDQSIKVGEGEPSVQT